MMNMNPAALGSLQAAKDLPFSFGDVVEWGGHAVSTVGSWLETGAGKIVALVQYAFAQVRPLLANIWARVSPLLMTQMGIGFSAAALMVYSGSQFMETSGIAKIAYGVSTVVAGAFLVTAVMNPAMLLG